MNDNSKPINGNIEAIIVDGVRYDKVKANTEYVCEECELREVCEKDKAFALKCNEIVESGNKWQRGEYQTTFSISDLKNISSVLDKVTTEFINEEFGKFKFAELFGGTLIDYMIIKDKVDEECHKQLNYENITSAIRNKLMEEGKIPYPTLTHQFLYENCVKSEKYATSLNFIMGAYIDFCRAKNIIPSTSRKVAMILKKRGIRVIRSLKGLYYCIELKGDKIGRELINNIEV